ncbi:MAG: transporter [Oscillospiraceae bacterium]|nr:transporter [Oscillospiraceae bacterium]
MRKKLQDKMFEVSYLFELLISVIVGVAILVFAVRLVVDMFDMSLYSKGAAALVTVLDDAIILAIGAELIKMLCKHTPETVIEVLAFALARQLIVGHAAPLENLITVVAIAVLFAVRRFLLNRHDMVETPDGLVEIEEKEEVPDVIPF